MRERHGVVKQDGGSPSKRSEKEALTSAGCESDEPTEEVPGELGHSAFRTSVMWGLWEDGRGGAE